MGLFDKKYCDICGEKIGLLGNRKLENGNLCKNCAKKLSPWFSDRRNSTVEEIKAQGEVFDPNLHYAVSRVENPEFGENVVAAVMQKGYTLSGKVIRHAMVAVANT